MARSPQRPEFPSDGLTGVGVGREGASFPSTQWTVLLDSDADGEHSAFAKMCHAYWYPLYAFLRRTGHSSHDAQDLTQGFFAKWFSGEGMAQLERGRGRFRSYLLGALKHYVAQERERGQALKRGGGNAHVSIEQELAEERYQAEPIGSEADAERLFDRQWALEVFRQVVAVVKADYQAKGKGNIFRELQPYVTGEAQRGSFATVAQKLGVEEVTVRSLLSRLRKHYRQRLRERVETLVDSPEEVDPEIAYLFEVMS